MKKFTFIIFTFCLTFVSCNSEENAKEENTQEEDFAKIENMRNDIIQYTQVNLPCTNPAEWGFIKIDPSGCAGNGGYILYSKKVNFSILEKKIEEYNITKGEIYTKWGIFVDFCVSTKIPTGVKCVDDKPELIFNIIIN